MTDLAAIPFEHRARHFRGIWTRSVAAYQIVGAILRHEIEGGGSCLAGILARHFQCVRFKGLGRLVRQLLEPEEKEGGDGLAHVFLREFVRNPDPEKTSWAASVREWHKAQGPEGETGLGEVDGMTGAVRVYAHAGSKERAASLTRRIAEAARHWETVADKADEEEPPAKLPPSFFSDAAAREALFKAGGDALYTALDAWDGGRNVQRGKAEHEREHPRAKNADGSFKYRVS